MEKLKRKLKKYNWELIIIMVVYVMSVLLVMKLKLGAIALKVMFVLIIIGVIMTTYEEIKQNFKNKNKQN